MLLSETPAHDIADLTPDDIGAIHDVYRRTLAAHPEPAAVRVDGPEFFEDIFAVGGEIIGLFEAGALVAYGVLRPEVASEHDRVATERLIPAAASLHVLDGSAVLPRLWGRGLQRKVIDVRIARAARHGSRHVVSKAAPANVPSITNLTRQGFAIVGRVMKPYGWRYVHYRSVAAGAAGAAMPAAGVWLPAADVDAAQARFDAGEAAFATRREAGGSAMLYFAAAPGES